MKKFIHLSTNVWKGKDFDKYMDNQRSEYPDPEMLPPVPQVAKLCLDPEDISMFMEVFSVEEAHFSESPLLDQIQITTKNGEDYSVNCTYDEFLKILEEHYQ